MVEVRLKNLQNKNLPWSKFLRIYNCQMSTSQILEESRQEIPKDLVTEHEIKSRIV